jgi:SAM-dependent MidA family methyltransferase
MIEQIRQQGELKVPEYWRQALTDEKFGYYRQSNVFSKEGDFTTSP